MSEELSESMPSKIVLYHTADGKVTVDVLFAQNNFWLTQKAMAELFGVNTPGVNKHLKNIYARGELMPEATVSKMEMVQAEGSRQVARTVEFEKFRVRQDQDYLPDFDQAFAHYLKGGSEA